MARNKIRIGDLLIEQGLLTSEQLQSAIPEQEKSGKKLGQTLVDMQLVDEKVLLNLLAEQLGIPYIDLDSYELNSTLAQTLPEMYARRFRAVVLQELGDYLLVGLTDPFDVNAIDTISRVLHREIKLAIIAESKIIGVLDTVYQHSDELSSIAEELSGELVFDKDSDEFDVDVTSADAPVVKLLQSIFNDAVKARASDIHIEPDKSVLRVRMRVDGVLVESILNEARIAPALVQRLKLRSQLDISEKRLPQDGRFNMKIMNKSFDVRISTMPIAFGEAVVMRLLDQSAPVAHLSELGMPHPIEKRLKVITSRPNGLLLVTGPTGSGKTTTLYSLLSRLNTPEKKIITVEDPVEYRISRINQVQVNPKIDLTFARVLRTVLRQDPDIVMVGEIRDGETAQIAMRAAMTGHLVLATLHTNDALSSALRLSDMGGEGFMVAASLRGVIAQRLTRKICSHCKQIQQLDGNELAWLKEFGSLGSEKQFYHGKGCAKCNFTGYHGRCGVYELIEPSPDALRALQENDPQQFADAIKSNPEYQSLSHAAYVLAQQGVTTIEEMIRVVGQLEE